MPSSAPVNAAAAAEKKIHKDEGVRVLGRTPSQNKWGLAMTNNRCLTASHIRYLLALKRLDTGCGIRSVDVAAALNLTKTSVHNMMDTFITMDYVEKEPNGLVYMTAYGTQRAETFDRYHRLLKKKLFAENSLDETADMAIYAFLAQLSETAWEALA